MNAAGAEPYIPPTKSLRRLSAAVQDCRGCDLYRGATQAVFGRGPRDAALMLVGEQPGHSEDLEGAPFVGPAGELLDRALERAGIDRAGVYVTNVVKHFKYEREGKRRIHKTPNQGEIEACRPWLFREIALVDPAVLRLSRRDRGARPAGSGIPTAEGAGALRAVDAAAADPRDHSSLRGPACPRRRAGPAVRPARRRSLGRVRRPAGSRIGTR